MSAPSVYRSLLLLTVLGVTCLSASTATGQKQRAFGPEWKKAKLQLGGHTLTVHERTVSVTIRHGPGNTAGFDVPLECRDVIGASEVDDNMAASVHIRP